MISLYPEIDFHINPDKPFGVIKVANCNYEKNINEIVNYPNKFATADKEFKEYLKSKILNSFKVQRMDGIGSKIVRKLFQAYLNNPQQLPDKTIYTLYKKWNQPFIDHLWDKYEIEKRDDDKLKSIIADLRLKYLNKDRHNQEFIPHLFRSISDYISGMTDKYAAKEYEELYGHSAF